MLRKLMKHEYRATARVMLPLFLAVLLLAGGVRLAGLLAGSPALETAFSGWDLPGILITLLDAGFFLSLAAVAVVTMVLMILRFRSNLLADEGYVMFTLPVSVHQLIWSKLWVSLTWFLLAAAVDGGALLLAVGSGESFAALREFSAGLSGATPLQVGLVIGEIAAFLVLGCLSQCLRFYAPMAIGHSFARHKTLLSVVFFLLLDAAVQTVVALLVTLGSPLLADYQAILSVLTPEGAFHGAVLAVLASVAAYCAVLYALTAGMLRYRLDLE